MKLINPHCVFCGVLVHKTSFPPTKENVKGDITLSFGFGSRHDGDVLTGCICDDCAVAFSNELRIPLTGKDTELNAEPYFE